MNVLELLSKELEDKDWTKEEKCRYLYIRSCELFSYDERYDFCDSGLYEGINLNQIRNRVIDLENVIDNRVICTTHAREVFSKIMKELLGIECKEEGTAHIWTSFRDGKRIINADATLSSDLARVKMGLTTSGYRTAMNIHTFKDDIRRTDLKIGYIKDDYENSFIQGRKDVLFQEFIKHSKLDLVSEHSDDFLIYKLYTIKELFEKYKLSSFSDSEFCISYLIKKMLNCDRKGIKEVCLFECKDDEHWNFINIYPFELSNEVIYFILHKVDGELCFYETTESDAKNYVKSLNGINKEIMLKNEYTKY